MTWVELHRQSELLASAAESSLRSGDITRAEFLYARAADWETQALEATPPDKLRTLGITAVSAAALWYKAKQFGKSEGLAYRFVARPDLPNFAKSQLKDLLQAIGQKAAGRPAVPSASQSGAIGPQSSESVSRRLLAA